MEDSIEIKDREKIEVGFEEEIVLLKFLFEGISVIMDIIYDDFLDDNFNLIDRSDYFE